MVCEKIGRHEIINNDCISALMEMEDCIADAVVTDPPYCSGSVGEAQRSAAKGQGLRSETLTRFGWFKGDNMGTAGLAFMLRAMAWEAQRVLKPSGSLLVFCDWRMLPSLAPAIESVGLRYQNMVVWDKEHMGLGQGFRAQHELVMHFTNGKPEYHSKSLSNVLKSRRVSSKDREHQTQKPTDLMQQLLNVVCPAGGTVIDPFMGSGSTGVAAAVNGMRFIGIERDAGYYEIAKRRILEAECALIDAAQEPIQGALL